MIRHHVHGYTITEMIVIFSLVSMIAVFGIAKITRTAPTIDETRQSQIVADLNAALDLAKNEQGLLPLDFGPAQALRQTLNLSQFGTNLPIPPACQNRTLQNMPAVQAGDSTAVLTSGVIVAGLSDTWDTSAIGTGADTLCVVTNGLNSNESSTLLITLRRRENAINVREDVILASATTRSNSGLPDTRNAGDETQIRSRDAIFTEKPIAGSCSIRINFNSIAQGSSDSFYRPHPLPDYDIYANIYGIPSGDVAASDFPAHVHQQSGRVSIRPMLTSFQNQIGESPWGLPAGSYRVEVCPVEKATGRRLPCADTTVATVPIRFKPTQGQCNGSNDVFYDFNDPLSPKPSNQLAYGRQYTFEAANISWFGNRTYFNDDATAHSTENAAIRDLYDAVEATSDATTLNNLEQQLRDLKTHFENTYGPVTDDSTHGRKLRLIQLTIEARRLNIPRFSEYGEHIRINVPYDNTQWQTKLSSMPQALQDRLSFATHEPLIDGTSTSNVVLLRIDTLHRDYDQVDAMEELFSLL